MTDYDINFGKMLTRSQERLAVRNRQRDEAQQLRLVKKDEQIAALRAELAQSNRQQCETVGDLATSNALLECTEADLEEKTAQLLEVSSQLSQRTAQLAETNRYLLEKTERLQRAYAELKLMMNEKEDFVAALTHDLKGPLIGSTKVLEFLASGQIPDDKRDEIYAQLVQTNKTMLSMIWNLLDNYKSESGSLVSDIRPFDFDELLRECVTELSFHVKLKQIELCLEFPNPISTIQSDRILVRRVLINLLENAIKFSPSGGRLEIGGSTDGQKVSFYVKDSGRGMSEDQRTRVFHRFWQTKEGRDAGIGFGLGLHVSRQIVELLGGTIHCESEINVGSKFTITLPLCGAPAQKPQQEPISV